MKHNYSNPFKNLNKDIPASIVVFLVALPLCLGIALASGAPLFAGLIAGIIGGIVIGALSGSPLGVSGPAAGLAVIVVGAIDKMGGFEFFLVAVVIAGILQLLMGFLKAGIIAYYFPSSVIHGMLAGIGILIFLKQIPHAFGYDKDAEGDLAFLQQDGQNTFSELLNMLDHTSTGVMMTTAISLLILLVWQIKPIQKNKILSLVPAPLLAVISGILLQQYFIGSSLEISRDHLVKIPESENMQDFLKSFSFPNFSALLEAKTYVTAIVIAVVASLETLLCVEASDKQDTHKRTTPTNRELKAQGVGNIISGLIGGLPITQVIVRSSANQQAGGASKASTFLHGILLLLSVLLFPSLLNKIPLATLAAILLVIGYKLAKPTLFKKMYAQGFGQFIPFVVTIVGMLLTDLLMGIGMGLAVAIFVILRNNYKVPYVITNKDKNYRIVLSEDVTFLNKASILKTLALIPSDSHLVIDASKNYFMHNDVKEIIEDFKTRAEESNIVLELIDFEIHKKSEPLAHFELKE